jgi:adenosylcobinamide-phosphate synthase
MIGEEHKLLLAAVLDIIFADPHWFPHPVRLIGSYIEFCEIRMRKLFPMHLFFAGLLTGLSTVVLTFSLVFTTIKLSFALNHFFGICVEIIWIYLALSAGELSASVMKVFYSLCSRDIRSARKNLSMIVGRDTDSLDENEISRAAIETTAESFLDGILAPLFFFVIGGAPLMWAYKAVNTADSMIGHKDQKYIIFGRFSAKLDDFANFAPARLSPLIIAISAFFLKLFSRTFFPLNALSVSFKDARKHASPNSGFPEAAFAGALNIRLGGTNYYALERYDGPLIGEQGAHPSCGDIPRALKLMWISFFISLLFIALHSSVKCNLY